MTELIIYNAARKGLKLIALRGGLVPLNEKNPAGSLAEPKFVCSACCRGADVRPDLNLG